MKSSITNKQIAFIIFGAVFGYGVIELPKSVAEEAGTGGWISIIISTLITLIGVYIFTFLGLTFKGKTIAQYSELLVGKFFSKVIIVIYTIYFFTIVSMVIRISSEIIRLTILIKTPVFAIAFSLTLVTLYGVTRGLGSIALIVEFYGTMITIFAAILNTTIFTQGEIINLRPFLGEGEIMTYIKAVPTTILAFLGIETLLVIPFDNLNKKKTYIYNLVMMFLIGIVYLSAVESVLSVLGQETIIYHKDTILAAIRRINVKGLQIFRRIDGIFLIAWIMTIFCTLLMYAYATIYLVNECLGKCFKKLPFNILSLIIMFMVLIVGRFPKTLMETELVLKYVGYFSSITVVIIPIILFLIAKVRKYDKKMD